MPPAQTSAAGAPGAVRLFHGTTHRFAPGEVVTPARTLGIRTAWPGSDDQLAYATTCLQSAKFFSYAFGLAPAHFVYEVAPVDPSSVVCRDLQSDPSAPAVVEHASAAGFRVLGCVWTSPGGVDA